jgi:AraC-like DNA-binding protein
MNSTCMGWKPSPQRRDRLEQNGHAAVTLSQSLRPAASTAGAHEPAEYLERPVHAALAEHVVCTWVDVARHGRHPVLPDACIDLVWDGTGLFVAGPDTRAVPITSQATFVGIRFRPGAASGFLGVAASELLDRSVRLGDLWGRSADELAEQLAGEDPAAVAARLELGLLQRHASARAPDSLVEQTLYELSRLEPRREPVGTLVAALGVSERTLRRRCTQALGYGPKTLDRILRFRRALRLLGHGYALADVARQAGYADQAHLSNECQRLASATPAALARRDRVALTANGCD